MSTSLSPTPARIRRAARLPVLLGLLVVLTGVLVVVLTDQGVRGALDPAAIDRGGSRAVAELLRDRGVDVQVARDTAQVRAAAAGTTVLVPFPGDLSAERLGALRGTAADVVLVEPGYAASEVDGRIAVGALGEATAPREPGCALPAAVAAGVLELGGEQFTAPGATACYPGGLGASVLRVAEGGRSITVLGDRTPLTNGAVAEGGNAALALGLLGERPRLLWYLPSPLDTTGGPQRDLAELVPPWVRWGVVQLGVAAVLLVLWRARRLGPVVREPLPVVVRAAEAVEGRARLYRRAGARGHAAETLREAARTRLRPLVGLPAGAMPAELVDAVTARVRRPGVDTLLYGPPPGDDAGLVALARALDDCEGEVRRS